MKRPFKPGGKPGAKPGSKSGSTAGKPSGRPVRRSAEAGRGRPAAGRPQGSKEERSEESFKDRLRKNRFAKGGKPQGSGQGQAQGERKFGGGRSRTEGRPEGRPENRSGNRPDSRPGGRPGGRSDNRSGGRPDSRNRQNRPDDKRGKAGPRPPVKREKLERIVGVYRGHETGGPLAALSRDLASIPFTITAAQVREHGLKKDMVLLVRPGKRDESGFTPVEIMEVIADKLAGAESWAAVHEFGIPHVFPEDVLKETESLKDGLTKKEITEREDLREIPIVTIDGADAKDFDDAVWAEPWEDGHHIIVAIADVAHYVEEGGALDIHARERGNSTYFPDRVVPMLPERLSNDLCSLRPKVDRPVLAVHMYIDAQGNLKKHKFVRAVIHSAARLTYEQVQLAYDGKTDNTTKPLMETTIKPLYAAYRSLLKGRANRGVIDFDLPENIIVSDPATGKIQMIEKRVRLDSHKLIEEMMILANVAAATALESRGFPALYRIHPEPSKEKIDALQMVLKQYGLKVALSGQISPGHIQGVVEAIRRDRPDEAETLFQVVLKSQQQATYDPENIGHFGLNLESYAHFTSPIRRYSDLIVHRSLVQNLKLAGKGTYSLSPQRLESLGKHLSETERRSQQAEWRTRDRFTTRFYEDFVGKRFDGKVMSVMAFGVFLSIESGLAEGLLPFRHMRDHWRYDEKNMVLNGPGKRQIRIGQILDVTLIEADTLTGRLTFSQKGMPKPVRVHGREGREKKAPLASRVKKSFRKG